MTDNEKKLFMAEVKNNVIDYLQEELNINSAALKSYEDKDSIINSDHEVRKMREIEAIKLRDRIHEISRHIAVIKRMYNG